MKDLIKMLFIYLKPYKAKVIGALLLALPLAALKTYQISLIRPILDQGLNPGSSWNEILILAGTLLATGIVNYPLRFFHFYWMRTIVEQSTCDIRQKLYQKYQVLPMSYFSESKIGKLMAHATHDTTVFAQGFKGSIDFIREPLTALFLFGYTLYLDWKLTAVIILVFPLFLLIFVKSGKKVKRNVEESQEAMGLMSHALQEGLGGQKIIKAFNLKSFTLKRFQQMQEVFLRYQKKTIKVEQNASPMVEFVGTLAFSGILVLAYYRIQSPAASLTTGGFIAFVGALALLMDPIRKFSQANIHLNQARAAGSRLMSVLSETEEEDEGQEVVENFQHQIEFKNLSFSYGNGMKVLDNFSLTVRHRERVALVGLSGSGKSTLIQLLLRLYPVSQGEILLDGKPFQSYTLASLRSLFGLVSQDVFLFNETVRENLCLGKDFADEKLIAALKIAEAYDFVQALPEGLETTIGDRGAKLSGGQAQRLTIARAYLRDPEVLLFDEATSALDNESEKAVQQALERLAGNKTILAVAHRLTTIQNYDRIVVLKEGRKIEEGTHQELMVQNSEYRRLYELSKA